MINDMLGLLADTQKNSPRNIQKIEQVKKLSLLRRSDLAELLMMKREGFPFGEADHWVCEATRREDLFELRSESGLFIEKGAALRWLEDQPYGAREGSWLLPGSVARKMKQYFPGLTFRQRVNLLKGAISTGELITHEWDGRISREQFEEWIGAFRQGADSDD